MNLARRKQATKQKGIYFICTHDEVDGGEDGDRPVSPPVGICQDGADQRRDVARSLPGGHIPRGGDVPFMQLLRQVRDQIRRNPIIGQPLAAFRS